MRRETPVSSGMICMTAMLGILFVVLKLSGAIGWSWWLVTLPFWTGPAMIAILAMALVIGVCRAELDVLRHK